MSSLTIRTSVILYVGVVLFIGATLLFYLAPEKFMDFSDLSLYYPNTEFNKSKCSQLNLLYYGFPTDDPPIYCVVFQENSYIEKAELWLDSSGKIRYSTVYFESMTLSIFDFINRYGYFNSWIKSKEYWFFYWEGKRLFVRKIVGLSVDSVSVESIHLFIRKK